MGKFEIEITTQATRDLKKHFKIGNLSTIKKIEKIIDELKTHPTTGTAKPEALKGELKGFWSRRINQKDRMVYKVDNQIVIVTIISAIGHYSDK
jgi:toxin YoeB